MAVNHETQGRTLGEYEITAEEAAEDDNFRVLELPADLVDEHLTKTFTPGRYAKVCRDVAYFSNKVGNPPEKRVRGGVSTPGSGMRRAREGALYNLAHRKALLTRAVELEFIAITNPDGFEAGEGKWRFELEPRGAWFLEQYYGEHIPVRKVAKKKLSRYSAATNVKKIVVDAEKESAAKSVEKWNQQVSNHQSGFGDVETGYYHVPRDTVDAPEDDPAGEDIITWIDESDIPTQFDITGLDGDVHLRCDIETLAAKSEEIRGFNWVEISRNEAGELVVTNTDSEGAVSVREDNGNTLGIAGDYDPFVTSGAKDALKEATDARWEADYQKWYVQPDELLIGVEAMLQGSEVERVTVGAQTVATFTEYL